MAKFKAEKETVKKVANKKQEKKETKKTNKTPKEGYFKKVRKELKLVKWPTFKEVLKYTISTIVFCVILCALFLLLIEILSVVMGWF